MPKGTPSTPFPPASPGIPGPLGPGERRTIHFKAFFRLPADASAISVAETFQVQYFNSLEAGWMPVGNSSSLTDGALDYIFEIDPATYVPESAEANIDIAFINGILPSFRIIVGDMPAAEATQVVADYWVLYVDAANEIHIDFGNQFWLETAHSTTSYNGLEINSELHRTVFIPERDSLYLPPVWGALHETDKFAGYNPATHEVSVVELGAGGGGGSVGGTRGGAGPSHYPAPSVSIPKGLPVGTNRQFHFKARLFKNTDLRPLTTEVPLQLQVYRTGIPSWMNLGPVTIVAEGLYELSLNYDPASTPPGTLEEVLELGLAKGILPAIRLVRTDGSGITQQVVSEYWCLECVDGINIHIDFGSRVVLPDPGYAGMGSDGDTITTENMAALPLLFGDSNLLNAFWAVAAVPESFAGYNPATKELLVRLRASEGGGLEGATLEAVIMDLRAELECLRAQLLVKASTIETLTMDVASKSERISMLTTEKEAIGAVLLDKENEISDLKDTIDGYEAPATTVTSVYNKLADEVKSAKEGLSANGYELTNVNFDLKTFVGVNPDGTLKLNLVDSGLAKKAVGDAVSAITFGIGGGSLPTTRPPGLTPNVLGLTETMARQRLQQFGLKMKPIYQTTQSSISVGSSFKQSPEAGADAEFGDTITVIFAKGPTQ